MDRIGVRQSHSTDKTAVLSWIGISEDRFNSTEQAAVLHALTNVTAKLSPYPCSSRSTLRECGVDFERLPIQTGHGGNPLFELAILQLCPILNARQHCYRSASVFLTSTSTST